MGPFPPIFHENRRKGRCVFASVTWVLISMLEGELGKPVHVTVLSPSELYDSGTCSNAPQATHKINPWRSEATSGEA